MLVSALMDAMRGHWLSRRLRGWGSRPALLWRNELWSYDRLCDATDCWLDELTRRSIVPGSSIAICGDYSPKLCALTLAALFNRNIIVPMATATVGRWDRMIDVAEVGFAVKFDGDDARWSAASGRTAKHP